MMKKIISLSLLVLLFCFLTPVFTANAGVPPFACTESFCQAAIPCEFPPEIEEFCCVSGTGNPCNPCFWTGVECVNPAPSGACCLDARPDQPSCEILTEAECVNVEGIYNGDDTNCDPPACQPPPDHFKCYKVTAKGDTPKRQVNLDDQFESGVDRIMEPNLICNPVNKNGEGITNPDSHLTCYKITPRDFDLRDITVNNQFGDGQELTVVHPQVLCLPSTKVDDD